MNTDSIILNSADQKSQTFSHPQKQKWQIITRYQIQSDLVHLELKHWWTLLLKIPQTDNMGS